MTVSTVAPKATTGSSAAAASSSASSSAAGSGSSSSQAFDALLAQMRQTTTAGSSASGTATASGTGSASSDETEDRFLKLLVAQMKNQDPLNPQDNAQMTTQLAQINTVKGIDKLNTSIQKLVDRGASGSTTEAAAMVGRSVLVDGDTMTLPKGGTARGGYELNAATAGVKIDVMDASGAIVDTIQRGSSPAGLQTFEWAGTSSTAPGTYKFRVTAIDGGAQVQASTFSAAPVQAVARGTDGVMLQLGGYGSRTLDQVRGIL